MYVCVCVYVCGRERRRGESIEQFFFSPEPSKSSEFGMS